MPTDGIGNVNINRRLAAIPAADIAGYSALTGADEAHTVRDLKGHQTVVLAMIADHGGILAEFGSVVNAVHCAIVIQETRLRYCINGVAMKFQPE
jgi:adenylate cyclase